MSRKNAHFSMHLKLSFTFFISCFSQKLVNQRENRFGQVKAASLFVNQNARNEHHAHKELPKVRFNDCLVFFSYSAFTEVVLREFQIASFVLMLNSIGKNFEKSYSAELERS